MVSFGLCSGSSSISGGLGVFMLFHFIVSKIVASINLWAVLKQELKVYLPSPREKKFVFCYVTSKLKEVLFCRPLHCIRY